MYKPLLSIIIPRHNESLSFINDTINSIRDTIDVSNEVIVIDDGSKIPLPDIDGVTVIRHDKNFGVGRAFITGAVAAKSDNLFIMGSDIRFLQNQWASKMVEAVDNNPKSLICTICIGLNADSVDNMNLEYRRRVAPHRCGANILFFHDHISHPKKDKSFRNILECQWLPVEHKEGLVEVPSVLGAAYGVKKAWFDYVDMFWGHKCWGTLEPLCSLQSWLLGGNCLCHHGIETGHIFKREGAHGTSMYHLIYNKLMLAYLLLPDGLRDKMIEFLGENPNVAGGRAMLNTEINAIFAQRDKMKSKIVMDVVDYANKFSIDLRGYGNET